MLERLASHEYYYFLNSYLGYNQIPIAVEDRKKTTFTGPFENFAYWYMPFRIMQRSCDIPMMHAQFVFWYGGMIFIDFHG